MLLGHFLQKSTASFCNNAMRSIGYTMRVYRIDHTEFLMHIFAGLDSVIIHTNGRVDVDVDVPMPGGVK